MAARILIVEDDDDLRDMLVFNFRQAGFETEAVPSAKAGIVALAQDPLPDVVLLDLMLPDESGSEVCRRLRQDSRTKDIGVIMVTAKSEEIDRVVGFEVGADDYVVKPFSVRELVLRTRSLLRRKQQPSAAAQQIDFGPLRIDQLAHRAWVDDEEVILTALEFRLLATLHGRRGHVQSRDRLLEDVWEMDGSITTRTVDTHVKRLREKLGAAGRLIETVRGVGYRFASQP